MRLKMTRDQFEALYLVFKNHVITEKPTNDAEDLLLDFMQDVFVKLRKKMEAKHISDWSLILTPKETKAYKIYWQQAYLDKQSFLYESILIQNQIALIDKTYA